MSSSKMSFPSKGDIEGKSRSAGDTSSGVASMKSVGEAEIVALAEDMGWQVVSSGQV